MSSPPPPLDRIITLGAPRFQVESDSALKSLILSMILSETSATFRHHTLIRRATVAKEVDELVRADVVDGRLARRAAAGGLEEAVHRAMSVGWVFTTVASYRYYLLDSVTTVPSKKGAGGCEEPTWLIFPFRALTNPIE